MFVLLASCLGWAAPVQSTAFDPFVKNFVYHSGGRFDSQYMRDNLDLHWNSKIGDELPNHHGITIAACYLSSIAPMKLEFDPGWWARADKDQRWALTFHEFGHCVCNLDHPPEAEHEGFFSLLESHGVKAGHNPWMADNCPKSLMYPIVLSSRCVKAHREYYIKELFDHCEKVYPVNRIGEKFD